MSNVYYNLTDIPFEFQVAEPDGYDCFGHNHFHIIILVSSSLLRKTPAPRSLPNIKGKYVLG